jgi:tripartite-type tricarboxylate transporter receptor subunit TctC
MKRRTVVAGVAGAVLAASLTGTGVAQEFPSEPITMLVGFGAGGMTDTSSRIIAEKLEETLGVNVLVENKPGAGGLLAIAGAAEAPADGTTIVSFLTEAPFTSTFQGDPVDLEQWAMLGGYMPQERVLFARADAPFSTVKELVDYAKETPVTFADGGSFWSSRVMEAFAKKHDMTVRLVPFRSGAEGSAAILGGHVTLAETGVGTSAWHSARDGGLKILATLTPGGLAPFGYEEVPTFADLGADYVVRVYYGYAARADTPPERLEVLRNAFKEAVEDPDVQAKLEKIDLTPEWTDPETYASMMGEIAVDAEALQAYLKEE